MFKFIALFAVVMAVAVNAAPAAKEDKEYVIVPIVRSETTKSEDGSYKSEYESADGSSRQETASVVDAGNNSQALEVKGSYKYINSEGEEVEVFYTAGVNGFVPYSTIISPEISAVAEAAKDLPKYYDEKPADETEQ